MRPFEIKHDARRLQVGRSLTGRLLSGLHRLAITLPWTLGSLGLLFGIDWVGRRGIEPGVPALVYWAAVLGLGLFISVVLGFVRAMRRESWTIDLAEASVCFESANPWGSPVGVEVDLSNLDAVTWSIAERGSLSYVDLVFGAERERMAETRMGPEAITPVVDALRALLAEAPVELRGVEE